jgi:hypothetical protein
MDMKKIAIVFGVVALLVGGVGVGVWRIRQGVTPETTGPVPAVVSPEETDTAVSDHVTGQDSFKSLLALGKTLECTFRTNDEKMPAEGTAFFNKGKLRVDTMYTGASSSVETANMIISDDTMYTWSKTSAGSFAIKMPLSAIPVSPTNTQPEKSVSLESKVQYDCKPWQVDGSVFVPPTDITFMDMGEMMKGLPAGMMQVPQQ